MTYGRAVRALCGSRSFRCGAGFAAGFANPDLSFSGLLPPQRAVLVYRRRLSFRIISMIAALLRVVSAIWR